MPRLQLESSTTDRASLHPPRALWRAPGLARLPRPVVVVAGLLLLGAVALFFLPSLTPIPVAGGAGAPVSVEASLPVAASPAPATPVNPVPVLVVVPAVVAAPASTPAAMATSPTPAASLTAPAPVPVPVANVAALVQFKARGPSWVEVTDASGTTQLRKILNAGETVPVTGVLPLAVVVGRADAIDVQVRGQPFDLAALARDNIARFQVK